jgi:microcystin-dependent protein
MAWRFFTNSGKEKVVADSTPAGLIVSYGGASAPTGWLFCQGQEVLRSTYPKLDAALKTNYGSYTNGSGSAGTTHIRLPDLRGRAPVGYQEGSANRTDTNGPLTGTGEITGGSTISSVALGSWSGTESVTLAAAESGVKAHNHGASVVSHGHNVTNNSHTHQIGFATLNVATGATARALPDGANPSTYTSGPSANYSPNTGTAKSSGYVTTRSNSATAASSAHSNMMSSLVVNFIIRAI